MYATPAFRPGDRKALALLQWTSVHNNIGAGDQGPHLTQAGKGILGGRNRVHTNTSTPCRRESLHMLQSVWSLLLFPSHAHETCREVLLTPGCLGLYNHCCQTASLRLSLPAILAWEGPGCALVPSFGSLGLGIERRGSGAGGLASAWVLRDGCDCIIPTPEPKRVTISPDLAVVSLHPGLFLDQSLDELCLKTDWRGPNRRHGFSDYSHTYWKAV